MPLEIEIGIELGIEIEIEAMMLTERGTEIGMAAFAINLYTEISIEEKDARVHLPFVVRPFAISVMLSLIYPEISTFLEQERS